MSLSKKIITGSGLFIIFSLIISCSQNEGSFSSRPGFTAYFEKNKPSETVPNQEQQDLLTKYRPRVFLAKGQTSFIDFYKDYIAQGSLSIDGKRISDTVTQELLNQHKNSQSAVFRYKPSKQKGSPTIYARIHNGLLSYQDKELVLTFLSYNLVFANSGLVKGLKAWQRIGMGIVGSNIDWHQLDHYVGLTVALSDEKPIAVMLQQHNYQTTWLLTDKTSENTLRTPDDYRISIDVAMQSNELYLHSSEKKEHPSTSFLTKDNIEFLKTGKNKPMMTGWDITHGEVEQEYTLKFLPSSDAFYRFKGKLGESRKLPGRDGPPGADYATYPGLIALENRMISAYRPRDWKTEGAKLEKQFGKDKFARNPDRLNDYKRDFFEDLNTLK